MQPGASLARLVEIMDRLLAPDGCPWDREQTLETLRPFLVEETYEVLDALARDDAADHCEELGDLLMQIVFQAALRRAARASSTSTRSSRASPTSWSAGIRTCSANARRASIPPTKVLAQWDQIKARREGRQRRAKRARPRRRAARPCPRARPEDRQQGCGKVGFDWPGWEGSFAKVEEEVERGARGRDARRTRARCTPRSATCCSRS